MTSDRMTIERNALAFIVPRKFKEIIEKLYQICDEKHNGYICITLSTPCKGRSTGYRSQNHAINGYCQLIADSTGEDFGVVKMECKRRALRRGYPLMVRDGELVYSRFNDEPLPESERYVSTVQASFLIEEIIQLAAELGISFEENNRWK